MNPLVVAMCGLPGSGKSTLARALAKALDALVWDKDELREVLFPGRTDRAVNDACMEVLYTALPHGFEQKSVIILDGRPFSLRRQRERALRAARAVGADIVFVHCSAPAEVAKRRVGGAHVAADRDPALVERVAAEMEPFDEAIAVDTASLTAEQAAVRCLAEMNKMRARATGDTG